MYRAAHRIFHARYHITIVAARLPSTATPATVHPVFRGDRYSSPPACFMNAPQQRQTPP